MFGVTEGVTAGTNNNITDAAGIHSQSAAEEPPTYRWSGRSSIANNEVVAMLNFQEQKFISRAMQSPDDLVLKLQYVDSKGNTSVRIVSPIRFLSAGRFLALCLCRCEPRQFHLDRCSQVELKQAADYVMPVNMAQAS